MSIKAFLCSDYEQYIRLASVLEVLNAWSIWVPSFPGEDRYRYCGNWIISQEKPTRERLESEFALCSREHRSNILNAYDKRNGS